MEYQKNIWHDLTVVIPVHNRAERVLDTLESISCQRTAPGRLILVDDHSSDSTLDVLRDFSDSEQRFTVDVIESVERGASAARNTGLALVETKWTLFFDSDDLMMPLHLDRIMKTAAVNPDADIIAWDVEREEFAGDIRILGFESNDMLWHNIMHGNFATQRYIAKTDLFRKAGGWNVNQPIWNDIELGARLLRENPRVAKGSGSINVLIRASEDSITGRSWSSRYEHYLIACENLRCAVGKENERMIDLKMAILAGDMGREDKARGRSFYEQIPHRDWRTWLAFRWRKSGLRGIARILRPFYKIDNRK